MNNNCNIEYRPLRIEDFDNTCAAFQNENDKYAEFAKSSNFASFFAEWNKNPVFYFRMVNPDSQRWCGIVEFGDEPLSIQKGLHGSDLAQIDSKTTGFKKISKKPITYCMSTESPEMSIQYFDDGNGGVIGKIKEGNGGLVLDLNITPMPIAIFNHSSAFQPMPYFVVTTLVEGTYMGRPIRGTGLIDRYFMPKNSLDDKAKEKMYSGAYDAIFGIYSGVREDGRKEWVYATITNENGKGIGFYYIDGEEPILTNEVYLEADFKHLPYVYDDTVMYTDAIWTIGNKKIHFNGKWGTKGFTEYPKIEKHGQAQCFGTWYEGDKPYHHTVYNAFNEVTGNGYADLIMKKGFRIID